VILRKNWPGSAAQQMAAPLMRAAFLVLLACACGAAQEFRATLSGKITDPAGAAVSDARTEIRNAETGEVDIVSSNADGQYTFGFLIPGAYVITVDKPGFGQIVRTGVTLQVAARAVVDISLPLGAQRESVTVTSDAPLLETESADRGLIVESNRVLNTPLQGRNIFAQAWSAPGVVVDAPVQRLRPFDIGGSSSLSINGDRPSTNEVLVDGVSSLYQAQSVSYVPTVEAVKAFKVQTTNFDAEYGWTQGGVVNIVTQNGTNKFHGSLFEFFQNTHLNANTFNSNRTGVPRSASHINTFGGDLGGPLRRNKLFFSYTFEEIRQVIPDPFITSVPTARQKQGDFSQTYYGQNASGKLLQTIYDPFSTAGGTLARQPFPSNVIPPTELNPVALKVLSNVPSGNVPGDPVTGLNNLTNNASTRKFTDFFPENTVRVDYNLSDKTSLFVRYSRNALQEERGFRYSTITALNPADTGQNNPFTRENHNATLQLTRLINSSTTLDFRVGLERFKSESGASQGEGVGPSSLGFSTAFVTEASNWFPRFNWTGYQGAGAQPTYTAPVAQTNTFQASVSKIRGRNQLKFGGEFRLIRGYSQVPGYTAGNFSFDPLFTGANVLQIQPSSGNALASFLVGTPQSGFIQVNSEPARQEKLTSFYAQHKVRLTEKLTATFGMRWDYLGTMTDRFNQVSGGFAFGTPNPLVVPGLPLTGGVLFAGVNGNPRGIFDPSWRNFGPRVGAAYQLRPSTVLRGGYALVYGQTWNDPGNAPGFSQTTNMVTSVQAGIPADTLSNPFPTGILQPVGSSQGLLTALGQSYIFADRKGGNPPYVHQLSFEVQQTLARDFLLSVAYVGSFSQRLPVIQQLNALPLSALELGATSLTQSVPNPFAGLLPGTSLNGATIQRQQLLVPYPQFLVNGILEQFEPIGRSTYEAAQGLVYKRLSFGLNFSVAYTISKQMDQTSFANAQDTHPEKVIASWDIPQSLQINFVYDLPFGNGKQIGLGLARPLRWAVSGWEISSLTRLQKGMPLDLGSSPSTVPMGVGAALSSPSLDRWFNSCTLLANGVTRGCAPGEQPAWTVRQAFQLQTWSTRLASVRNPGIQNVDIAVMKANPLSERVALLFRADFINAFNSPQFFNGPVSDVNNPNFGRISGAMDQSNLPRFIQLSMKLRF
jgi:hypothetical protein